jgi:hypothetical protein
VKAARFSRFGGPEVLEIVICPIRIGVPATVRDAALDVAGSGVLPELIDLAGGPEHVVTIADFAGAREHGVRFSRRTL